MIISICYWLSLVFCISGMYFVRKSDKILNGFCFIFITIFFQMCINAIMCLTTLYLSFFRISDLFMTVTNILIGVITWYLIIKKGYRQKYRYNKADIIIIFILAIIAWLCGINQFGVKINTYNYQSLVDSSRHIMFARQIARHIKVSSGMVFMAANNGLVFESMYPFIENSKDIFIMRISDIFMLFMSGVMFWSLISRKISGNYMKVFAMFLTCVYTLGFPLNNMVFGTSYLGSGVTCVIFMFIIMDMYKYKEINSKYYKIFVCIAVIAEYTSYYLFTPLILLVFFMLYIIPGLKNKFKLSDKAIVTGIAFTGVFMIAIIIALAVASDNCILLTYPFSVLNTEGYIYRNLFGDFIIFIPFVILYIIKCLKKRELNYRNLQLFYLVMYIFAMGICVCIDKVSSYYFYKLYYLLWFVAIDITVEYLTQIKKINEFIKVYFATYILIAAFTFSGLENKIDSLSYKNASKINRGISGKDIFGIFSWNFTYGNVKNEDHIQNLPMVRQKLYEKVASLNEKTGKQSLLFGDTSRHIFDYYALTGCDDESKFYVNGNSLEIYKEYSEKNCDYICVLYNTDNEKNKNIAQKNAIYNYALQGNGADIRVSEYKEWFDSLKVVYSNKAGVIYAID